MSEIEEAAISSVIKRVQDLKAENDRYRFFCICTTIIAIAAIVALTICALLK